MSTNESSPSNTIDLLGMANAIQGKPLLRQAVGKRFIQFELGTDTYAVPITQVIETGPLPDLTLLPAINPSIRGVINFRGEVLPLLDLRLLLAYTDSFAAKGESLLVVRTTNSSGPCGLAVDRVMGLLALAESDIQPPVRNFTTGLSNRQGQLVHLLDLEILFHNLSLTTFQGDNHVR